MTLEAVLTARLSISRAISAQLPSDGSRLSVEDHRLGRQEDSPFTEPPESIGAERPSCSVMLLVSMSVTLVHRDPSMCMGWEFFFGLLSTSTLGRTCRRGETRASRRTQKVSVSLRARISSGCPRSSTAARSTPPRASRPLHRRASKTLNRLSN